MKTEYYSAIKKNELVTHAKTLMNFNDVKYKKPDPLKEYIL